MKIIFDHPKFRKRVRSEMEILGCEQKEVAEDTGHTESSVSRYLNGKTKGTVDLIAALAEWSLSTKDFDDFVTIRGEK